MEVVRRQLLEGGRLFHDLRALVRELVVLGLGGGVSGEVVPAEDGRIGPLEEEVAVEADLLGVEVCHREYLQGSGVVEDAKALGESLVQLGVLCSGDGDR